jgi:hypothetical protein
MLGTDGGLPPGVQGQVARSTCPAGRISIVETQSILLALAVIVAGVLALVLSRSWRDLTRLKKRFGPIDDIDKEREKLSKERDALSETVSTQRRRWEGEFSETIREFENLTKELEVARDSVELMSFGFYEPQFDFGTPDEYKNAIKGVRDRQRQLVRSGGAAKCDIQWQVEGSTRKGTAMTNRTLKLQLRAFNGESDVAVAKVRYNNILRMEERLRKARDAVNKLGASQQCTITPEYLKLKLDELHLAYEYAQKKQADKEEQREIRERMREEARAQQEIEKATAEAERDEKRYNQALGQARSELAEADERKHEALNKKIDELQRRLEEAHANKERALSRAQLTKSGHVYVISNIGSFGDRIYKIGMTRRLDPIDRVRELGDASVPFPFDVHAMIYSENAPELENELHRAFASRRVNLINQRREFFYVGLEEVEDLVHAHDAEIVFTRLAEAEQYRQSEAQRAAREKRVEEETAAKHAKDRFEEMRARWASTETAPSGTTQEI